MQGSVGWQRSDRAGAVLAREHERSDSPPGQLCLVKTEHIVGKICVVLNGQPWVEGLDGKVPDISDPSVLA